MSRRVLGRLAALVLLALASCGRKAPAAEPLSPGDQPMRYNTLTAEEERIIVHKGTEAPFSGRFNEHFETGAYVCRRCSAPLYPAAAKFRSACGWPSFDDAFAGAVRRQPDADGHRTEILCARCGAHLGHVFEGEGLTAANVRHCVNSLSLDFVPEDAAALRTAVFAGGCFWGVQHVLQAVPGVVATTAGYTGGTTEHPTYSEVCSGRTGHAEAVEVVFDARLADYETLARLFFETHDPTQRDRQGPDIGSQYRSAVFYHDEEQRQTVEQLIGLLRARGLDVVTEVVPAARFWPAEEYHQDYYRRTGQSPYCHVRVERF